MQSRQHLICIKALSQFYPISFYQPKKNDDLEFSLVYLQKVAENMFRETIVEYKLYIEWKAARRAGLVSISYTENVPIFF